MELADIGFDDWFQQKREELQRPFCSAARITRVDRDRYLVRNEESEVQAELTGKLLFSAESNQDLPCVGDWVLVQYHNDGALAIIHDLLPRKTFLRRKSAGRDVDYQMIASNIDRGLLVQSCDKDLNMRSLERYLVTVIEGHIEPIVLLSKSDIVSAEDLERRISEIRSAHISARIIPISSHTPGGLETLKGSLEAGKTYCLLGPSGVGKTTLVNRLIGQELFETNPVREKDGRGRHTTASRQLIVLESGGLLIDTPGMRELGLIAVGESIDDSFSDIHGLTAGCRFSDCTHTSEVGCAILLAVQSGELSEDRYQSYIKLRKESEFHQMSHIERRRKDKQFGRMIKSIKKQMSKK